MSYNIDRFHIKRLVDLKIPIDAFYKHEREDWHPKPKVKGSIELDTLTLSGGDAIEIVGAVHNGIFEIDSLEIYGEGSGTFMNWILEPALKESTGELCAVCVFEGGDSITKLLVENGQVDWLEVDLNDI